MIRNGTLAVIATAVMTSIASAASVDISFTNITGNGNSDLSAQLNLNVAETGNASMIDFTFTNNIGIASSIAEIYFDDGNPTGSLFSAFILAQSGTSFTYGSANPGDLPGGNAIADPFNVSDGFLADHGAKGPTTGINTATDFVTIRATLMAGMGYADVLSRFDSGAMRVGLHVIGIDPQGGSDSYVTGGNPPPPVVPLPTTAAMGIVGMCGLASRRRR